MLEKLVDGMERNGLLSCDDGDGGRIGNVLTGFIGSESFLSAVVNVVRKLKRLNPSCRYVCDPVLGDLGRFYVPEGLVDIYRREVLPLADIITPNQFEIEQLTGVSIRTVRDAQRACQVLHGWGVSLVLITSIIFPEDGHDGCEDVGVAPPPGDSIGMFASRRKLISQSTREQMPALTEQRSGGNDDEQYILYAPRLPGQFTGTGDICAALFLGWTAGDDQLDDGSENNNSCLARSLERLAGEWKLFMCMSVDLSKILTHPASPKCIVGTMHAIVQRTADAAANQQSDSSSEARARVVSSREMQLIQSRDDILHPPMMYRALRVPCDKR